MCGEYKLDKDCLLLYKPNIKIPFNSKLNDLTGYLEKNGFNLTNYEDRPPIYHGSAWITEMDKVVIHFYITDKAEYLDSIMLTCGNSKEPQLSSYQRRQKWLETNYGKAQIAMENSYYGVLNFEWELPNCNIKHFIHDRFGDEEGIYIKCL